MKRGRLDELEQRAAALIPKPSWVCYEVDGVEHYGAFDEMLEAGGKFVRFADNSGDLRDVRRLLALWDEEARRADVPEEAET